MLPKNKFYRVLIYSVATITITVFLIFANINNIGYVFPDEFHSYCAVKNDGDHKKVIIDNYEISVPKENFRWCNSPYLSTFADTEPHEVDLKFSLGDPDDHADEPKTNGDIDEASREFLITFSGYIYPRRRFYGPEWRETEAIPYSSDIDIEVECESLAPSSRHPRCSSERMTFGGEITVEISCHRCAPFDPAELSRSVHEIMQEASVRRVFRLF